MATVLCTSDKFKPLDKASAEVENTTTATIFADAASNEVIQRIPANSLSLGDTFELYAVVHVNDNNSTDTLALDYVVVDNASTPNSTDFLGPAAFDAQDNDFHIVRAFFTCTALGTSGTLTYSATYRGLEAALAVEGQAVGTATVDTTTAVDFKVEATWSVAHADNEVELRQLMVRKCGYGESAT